MSAGYRVERPGFTHSEGKTWAWRCDDADHPWHLTVDDQGFTYTHEQAERLGQEHVERFHGGTDHPICGERIRGRLSLRCNQLESHPGACYYVTKHGQAFSEVSAS